MFGEIVDSSVWRLPLHVRVAWITVLAMKDFKTHKIRTNPYLLADKAKITEAQAAEALDVFLAPDKHSLNPANEGRRLQKLDAGEYLVLNGSWWSRRMARENKKLYDREYQAARRDPSGFPTTDASPTHDGFPANDKQAAEWCEVAGVGVPPNEAKQIFHEASGRGGKDYRGVPIQRWASYAKAEFERRQQYKRDHPGSKSAGSTIAV